MNTSSVRHILSNCCLVVSHKKTWFIVTLGVSLLVALWNFLYISSEFVALPPQGDAYFFLAVGRNLLNGFHLYWDMFEPKPPIIFWLTAASLRMGQPTLYMYIQICLLLSLAPALGIFVHRMTKDWIATSCAVLLGLTVAYEVIARTAAYLPEGFGAPLAVFAILLYAYPSSKIILRTVLAGVLLGLAAMTKEPFVGSFVLGALIFCRSKQDVFRLLAILGIGGATSILMLTMSGTAPGYFLIYLPEVFGGRSVGKVPYPDLNLGAYYLIAAPLWLRMVNAYKLFAMMAVPPQSFLFSVFFFTCVGLFGPLRTEITKNSIKFSFLFIALIVFSAHIGYLLYGIIASLLLAMKTVHMGDLGNFGPLVLPVVPILLGTAELIGMLLVPFVLMLFVLAGRRLRTYQPSGGTVRYVIAALAGLFCTAGLVAYGGDYIGQYFGFAVPPLVALAVYCLWESARRQLTGVLVLLSCLLIVHSFVPGKLKTYLRPYASWAAVEDSVRQAQKIDALMDSCGLERYFDAESVQGYFAFTHHSPYQIFYGQERAQGGLWAVISSNQTPNPYFATKFADDLRETKIIFALPEDDPLAAQSPGQTSVLYPVPAPSHPLSRLPAALVPVLRDEFTLTPPSCAAPFMPIEGEKVYFRRS